MEWVQGQHRPPRLNLRSVLGSWARSGWSRHAPEPAGPGSESPRPAHLSSVIKDLLLERSEPRFPHLFSGDPPTCTEGQLEVR